MIIVGAGRSGTKMLRAILASHPSLACFPREINYVWRHGNLTFPTDELRPEHARPEVVRYIRKRFERLSARHKQARIVEKTCANVLRIDFVLSVFPTAQIIHLVRDGRAVAESARRRWQARPDPRYLWEKARWLPVQDLPYYCVRYFGYQLGRFKSIKGAQGSWGPRFSGIDTLVAEKALIEVCGLQWKACILAAEAALGRLPPTQAITVRYEDLVNDPEVVAQSIFEQVNLSFPDDSRAYVKQQVRNSYVDKWQESLTARDLDLLMPHIESELLHYGYR